MAWSRGGTVSVTKNSTTVTGAGTGFVANSRVGDAFLGPDGAWYEVANIASDTALSILPAYLGASASGAAYALAPIQGYTKASADALRGLVNSYGTKLAALGTTGNYEILPIDKGGTGVAADSPATLLSSIGAMPAGGGVNLTPLFANIRAAITGANPASQGAYIGWNESNGSGLSGGVSFTCNQGGGTGGFSWRTVNSNNTVGGPFMTYSYAGVLNVPLGIQLNGRNIVESGTNSAGTYIRYADGTQECHKRVGTDTITGAVANLFASNAYGGGAFPAAFVGVPTVVATASVGSGTAAGIWAGSYSPSALNDWGSYRAFSPVSISGSGAYINLVAKGRWY
jgi:hypothetical protein